MIIYFEISRMSYLEIFRISRVKGFSGLMAEKRAPPSKKVGLIVWSRKIINTAQGWTRYGFIMNMENNI